MEAVTEKTRNASGLTLLIGTALASVYRPAKMLLPVYGALSQPLDRGPRVCAARQAQRAGAASGR